MRTSSRPRTPVEPEWRQPGYKDVVRETFTFRESLPLPIVTYPHIYGTWIAFQEAPGAQPFLCECQRPAVSNAVRLDRVRWLPDANFAQVVLPGAVWGACKLRAASHEEVPLLPIFRLGICHLCCRRVPPVRWSNLGEYSSFLQHFGWYWHYALLARGVDPFGYLLPLEQLDPEIASMVDLPSPDQEMVRFRELKAQHGLNFFLDDLPKKEPTGRHRERAGWVEAWTLGHRLNAQRRRIGEHVEAQLRVALGFPARGRTGFAEILLLWIVRGLFPLETAVHRARLPELFGLELDVYLPALRLGIEYQGHQHYYALEHLGGKKGLRNVRRRDKAKAKRCRDAGIDLVEVTLSDRLSEDFVRSRLLAQNPRLGEHLRAGALPMAEP